MTGRCSTCSMPLVNVSRGGLLALVCPRPACPGHECDLTLFPPEESAQ
jgi:hypothetical protein